MYIGCIIIDELRNGAAQIIHDSFNITFKKEREGNIVLSVQLTNTKSIPILYYCPSDKIQIQLEYNQFDLCSISGISTITEEVAFTGKFKVFFEEQQYEFDLEYASPNNTLKRKIQRLALLASLQQNPPKLISNM